MLIPARFSLLTSAACALAALFPVSRAHADSLVWGTSGYTYNATTQVGTTGTGGVVTTVSPGTANANTVSIQYSTANYFTNNGNANTPSPAVGTNTANTAIYTDGGTNNGTQGTGNQALQILANFDSGTVLAANAGITITVFFSKPVSNLLFSFWDVDTNAAGANAYNDLITNLYGRNSTSTNPNSNIIPGRVSNGAANNYGTGSNANGSYATVTGAASAIQGAGTPANGALPAAAGVATVQFSQPVTQFSFTYTDTNVTNANGTTTHSAIQMFGLSDLQFTTVPEPSTWAFFAAAGGLSFWTLRRRARQQV